MMASAYATERGGGREKLPAAHEVGNDGSIAGLDPTPDPRLETLQNVSDVLLWGEVIAKGIKIVIYGRKVVWHEAKPRDALVRRKDMRA